MTIRTAVTDRFELITVPRSRGVRSFADDVARGLSGAGKRLPSKYFYDDVGSALFDVITRLPEYYLTGAEAEILRDWGWQIVRLLNAPVDFLELGSGSAVKTRRLIGEALRAQAALCYSPIDISTEALRTSSLALVEAFPSLRVRAYAGDYFDVLESQAVRFERKTLAMLMGSNIGNYEPGEARELLRLIGAALRPGDGLLLGADLKKDRATLELAYDDPTGVTAAFNLNLLARINRELGANFDVRNFTHVAHYDEVRGSVDSFLEARDSASVTIAAIGLQLELARGERIHTESSYKFEDREIVELGSVGGFRSEALWHDRAGRFSLHLLVRE